MHNGKELYKCDICGQISHQLSDLKKHKLVHSDEKLYKCGDCDYASNYLGRLYTHTLVHSGKILFKCNICGYVCKRLERLQKHNLILSRESEAACTETGQVKEHGSSLEIKLSTQIPETIHSCVDCEFYTKSTLGLQKHLLQHIDSN